jgi:hypothetical protein
MTSDKGWKKTARLAPAALCDAAAEEFRNSGSPSELLNHAGSKCSALLRHIFKVRAYTLVYDEQVADIISLLEGA